MIKHNRTEVHKHTQTSMQSHIVALSGKVVDERCAGAGQGLDVARYGQDRGRVWYWT